MNTYLKINTQDLKKLKALANAKQLSISTTAGIIINHYNYIMSNFYQDKYINEGENLIHIKVRAWKGTTINTLIATNSVYSYFHQKDIDLPKGLTFTKLNRMIQKEMDTYIDKNVNKNLEMRIQYRLQKGKI